jgi:hypothetical protein
MRILRNRAVRLHRVRPSRLIGVVAVVASSLALTGGALLVTTTPASAVMGGLQTCQSLNLTLAPTTFPASGTISGCNSKGHNVGTVAISNDSSGSITWASGMAASQISVGLAPFAVFCLSPFGNGALYTLTITVVSGPYAGTSGGAQVCATPGPGPNEFTAVNQGPVTL